MQREVDGGQKSGEFGQISTGRTGFVNPILEGTRTRIFSEDFPVWNSYYYYDYVLREEYSLVRGGELTQPAALLAPAARRQILKLFAGSRDQTVLENAL